MEIQYLIVYIGVNNSVVLYTNIDQIPMNSLPGLLTFEIGVLDRRVITTEYKTRCQCIHM